MTIATKTRWVRAGLVVLALWPLAQHALVRTVGLTPWKFAAWGMYSTPQANIGVTVLVANPRTGEERVVPRQALPPEFWNEAARFSRERWALGRWRRPDALGRRVLDYIPPAEKITVVVSRVYVDRKTAMVEVEQTPYEYRR